MSGQAHADGVRPAVALALATVGFVALLIAGLGILSLVLDQDVIAVRGLGQVPGITGTILAVGAFGAALWASIRRRPTYIGALGCALAAFLGYVGGVLLGAAFSGSDLGAAAAAAGGVAASWFGVVVAGAGLISGWGGVALVRTHSDRPRWPWEDPYDE